MWTSVCAVIQENSKFLITTHVNPDGDGVGAAMALTELLVSLGKQVRFVTDGPPPEKFGFLDRRSVHELYDSTGDYSATEVMIVLDTHRIERIGRLAALLDIPKLHTICIDHHEVTETFTQHTVIDPAACSVGMMVHDLIMEMGKPLTREAAQGIYVSILCDTGRFSYSSTTREAHRIADLCLAAGVDANQMYNRVYQRLPLREMRMFSRVLHRMETHLDDRVAIQVVQKDDLEGEGDSEIERLDLEYVHEFTKMIQEVECVVLLRELPSDRVRISCRAKNELDMGRIMRQIGGGGHSKAAGATWDGTVHEAKRLVLDLLEKCYQPVGIR